MGEIHELFVLALSLVWFAGTTPDRSHLFGQFSWKIGEKGPKTPKFSKIALSLRKIHWNRFSTFFWGGWGSEFGGKIS